MLIRRTAVVAAVAGLAFALPAAGQVIPWLNPVVGNWNDATKWTGGNVPDASGETAEIGMSGVYTVTQNVAGLMLDAIDITNVDAILSLGGNTTTLLGAGISNFGTIATSSGANTISGPFVNRASGRVNIANTMTLTLLSDVTNHGTLTVNSTGGGSNTTLKIDAPITIGGTGEIVLNRPGSLAQIITGASGALTIGPDQTIRGQGQITGVLANSGMVQADVPATTLRLGTNPKTNDGVMRAAGGTLDIISIAVTQGAAGEIRGDGTFVELSNATINSGLLNASGGGGVRSSSGTSILNDVNSAGLVQVANTTTIALAGGAFTNNGTVDVNYNLGGTTTSLRVDGPLAIDGTGEIFLRRPGTLSQINAGTDGALTLGSGQTVRGEGQITVPTINNGLIVADVPAGTLLLTTGTKTNNGTMAALGGTLAITSIAVNQSALGEVIADGSDVTLSNSTIASGTIRSSNGGLVQTSTGTSVFDAVESEADVQVLNTTTLALKGSSYTNNGTIVVNPTVGGSTTTLRIDDDVTIDGAGEIVLNAPGSRARIATQSALPLTLGADQTIRGQGQIAAAMNNYGVIDADFAGQSLALNNITKSNYGLMTATAGTLAISGISIPQFGSAEIRADGADVTLTSASILGGTIRSTGAGIVRQSSGTSMFQGVSSEANVEVANTTTLIIDSNLTNNGTITVNPTLGGSTTTLRIDNANTIDGTGEIILNAPGSRAQIISSTGSLILGPGQTLRGIGQVTMPFTIEGTIAPGLSIGSLAITAAATTVTWQPGSNLDVELGSISSFDKITLGSHTINGGTVNVTLTDSYMPALFDTHAIIDGGTGTVLSGKFDAVTGPALPAPFVWRVGYTDHDVLVGVTCPSDVNADFTVDVLDFLDFLDAFGNCENQPAPCGTVVEADYNGDTFVDVLDFLDFLDAFGTGC